MSTTIIFAGGDPVPTTLRANLPVPNRIIAADSGYRIAAALGYRVDVVIGDFDSLSPETNFSATTELVRYPAAKDATDLELAFEFALADRPDRIVLVGGEGGRFDHELATTMLLASDRWKAVPELEWVRTDAHCYVVRSPARIQGDQGELISLIALGGDASGVFTTGLLWELSGETIYATSTRGVSNIFDQSEALIRVEAGVLLAVVPTPADD